MAFDLSKIRSRLESIPAQFANKQAKVGWFPSAKYEDGTNVAYVALIQEVGAPEVGIPARPFMKPAVEANKDEWASQMRKGAKAVLNGRVSVDNVLEQVGMLAASDVQVQIETGDHQELSPTTILLRKWRREGRKISGKTVGEAAAAVQADPSLIAGVNADPLRDSGLMIATLTSQVGRAE